MDEKLSKIVKYYERFNTHFGNKHILYGAQHFGYYPGGAANITEKEAQLFYNCLVGKELNLTRDEVVLDAGCGQGVVSTFLAAIYDVKIEGITIVPHEITDSLARAKKMKVQDKVSYKLMDYSQTEYANEYFDKIYTTETLSHSTDIQKTVREFFRILKPGGEAVFFEYKVASDTAFSAREKRMLDLVIDGSGMFGLKEFYGDKFLNILRDAGFEHVNEREVTKNMLPSLHRLHKIAKIPYFFVRMFNLQKYSVNTTAGYEYYKMAVKGLFEYNIISCRKPE